MQRIEIIDEEKARKLKPLDDIEKFTEPASLYDAMEDSLYQLRQKLSKVPEKFQDVDVNESLFLLSQLLNEIHRLIPFIKHFDFKNIPVNGLRSDLRFCIKLIDTLNKTKNPVKLQNLTMILARHLSEWTEMLKQFRELLSQGQFEWKNSRQILIHALRAFNSTAHQVLIHRRFMTMPLDKSMYGPLLIIMRFCLWYLEPSLRKKLFTSNYFTFRGVSYGLLTKISTCSPERIARAIRFADSPLMRTILSTQTAFTFSLNKIGTKFTQKRFKFNWPASYSIQVTEENVFFRLNEPASFNGQEKIHSIDQQSSVTKIKFFLLRSEKRTNKFPRRKMSEDSMSFQSNVPQAAANVHKIEEESMMFKKTGLIKGKQGRCSFYSSKKPINIDHSSCNDNRGKIFIYLHGGAFFGPKPRCFIDVYLRKWSNKLPGVTFIVPEYAYIPESTFPVAWQQLLDLYLWLVTSADAESKLQMNINPKKIVICGDSSGGLLATSLFVMLNEINKQFSKNILIPNELILIYPKTSMTLDMNPSLLLSYFDFLVNSFVLIRCAQSILPITKKHPATGEKYLISQSERKNLPNDWYNDENYQLVDSPILSPIKYAAWNDLTFVNLNVFVMTFDPLLDDGVDLARKWKANVNLHVSDNINHGALFTATMASCANSFSDRVLEVITSVINSL